MAGNGDGDVDDRRPGAAESEGDIRKESYRAETGMAEETRLLDLSFLHRSRLLKLHLPAHTTLLELGHQLVSLSGVAPHTLRLLLPRVPAVLPFSPLHSALSLSQAGISEERVVRMMGALPEEINEVSHEAGKAVERTIIGFSEEVERAKRWKSGRSLPRALPRGNYIFCDFRTLQLPGIELNPPASRALEIMHKLASDPGIVAIMNKHRWRVGVMTEMAPVGYVGISPKCILGYNKNQGEEISLRLRTDDLKGFRKYESIKQTLLHELAHMVHSEHDAHFHAFNKQLNEEAMALDWTKSGGQSLGGYKSAYDEEEEDELIDRGGIFMGGAQKLGGSNAHNQLDARSAAALAALLRLSNKSESDQTENATTEEISFITQESESASVNESYLASKQEPDPDEQDLREESDSDKLQGMELDEPLAESHVDPVENVNDPMPGPWLQRGNLQDEQEAKVRLNNPSGCECCMQTETDLGVSGSGLSRPSDIECDGKESAGVISSLVSTRQLDSGIGTSEEQFAGDGRVPLGEDPGLKSLQESAEQVCQKLQSAIAKLQAEASPSEAAVAMQSLYKILRNLMEHPHEEKFKRLRKANAVFQNRIARFKGAIEVLQAVGFSDEPGVENGADYLILKRNDAVLLWLAQSSLEACMA